jgi:hypothetical protein
MVADLRHVVFSHLRLIMRKCENTNGQQICTLSSFQVFPFRIFEAKKKKKIRDIKFVVYSHSIRRIFAFSRLNTKMRKHRQTTKNNFFCLFAL